MIELLLVHESTVERYRGTSGSGARFELPEKLACYAEDLTRLVRDQNGAEVVSSTRVFYGPGVDIPVGSKVTVLGRRSTVLTVARHDSGGLTELDHVEVHLA